MKPETTMKTETTMKATITTREPRFNPRHRKETPCHLHTLTVLDLSAKPYSYENGVSVLPEVVTLRIYVTASGATSAAVWIRNSGSGTGAASGGGYCKKSAAAAYSIRNAGIDLSEDIAGRGMSAVREAVCAVARAMGVRKPCLVESHA